MHQISDDELRKFLSNELSARKARKVSEYLMKYPERSPLYENLQEEWNTTDNDSELVPGLKEAMYSAILTELEPKKAVVFSIYARWAAAAAILLLIFAAYSWWSRPLTKSANVMAVNTPVVAESNMGDTVNNSEIPINMRLSDNSEIMLYPKSRLQYFKNGAAVNKRDLYVDGKALFKVAKNIQKPFTVYTGRVSVTALGTSFTVINENNKVEVKLHTGKVLLKSEIAALAGWDKNVTLIPGESMLYDGAKAIVKVEHNIIKSEKITAWTFENAELDQVLNKLSTGFHVTIDYNSNDLKGMRFTGIVQPSDSLAVVLNMIANLNGLKISNTVSGFKLEKIN